MYRRAAKDWSNTQSSVWLVSSLQYCSVRRVEGLISCPEVFGAKCSDSFVCLSWKWGDSLLFCAHVCLEKESGERNDCGHVCMCVGSHTTTVDASKNDTFLLLLAGSKGEGTCERREKPPHAVMEMWCWKEQGTASRRRLGWHYGFSTAAAHGNVCRHRSSAYMWGGGDSSLTGGKAGEALGMWIPQKQIC